MVVQSKQSEGHSAEGGECSGEIGETVEVDQRGGDRGAEQSGDGVDLLVGAKDTGDLSGEE